MTIAWCVKCKTKREMKNPKLTTAKNGRLMYRGTCSKCGTKMNLFTKGDGKKSSKSTKSKKSKKKSKKSKKK